MKSNDSITIDADILGVAPVKSLFEYLENNYTLDEFLKCFPSVTRKLACRVLESLKLQILAPSGAASL